ncbi:MAG: DJ-1/PfpI family protein [Nitrospinota bacterium]
MKIAFIIFDGMTSLDFVGFYDPITRLKTMGFLPDLEWEVCGRTAEVRDTSGLLLKPDRVSGSLRGFDMTFLPGGSGTRTLKDDAPFIEWIRTARPCRYKVSVCSGALLLGAAGFLEGKTATTHPGAYDLLQTYTPKVSRERIVDEGEVITGGGVSSSIDLGLYLCEKFAGAEARKKIQKQMDYPYEAPPPLRPQAAAGTS